MSSMKDKFLSAQRAQVKTSLWGKLNVFQSVVTFNLFDLALIGYFWYLHHVAVTDFDCSTFRDNLIATTILASLSLLNLVRGPIFFYSSVLLYLVRFWHVCHITGKGIGLMIFHAVRLSSTFQMDLYSYYIHRILVFSTSTLFLVLRLIFILISCWYTLVLERIRVAGGTGFERKTAEEFEMEALDQVLVERENLSNALQVQII